VDTHRFNLKNFSFFYFLIISVVIVTFKYLQRDYYVGEKMKRQLIVIYLCTLLMVPLLVSIAMANEPPSAPQIDGPKSGKAGELLTYIFTSTDPEGDDISYYVWWDWGCGGPENSEFVPSGESVSMSHTYSRRGSYRFRVMAKDINQAESNLSEFEVTVPRTRVITNYIWFNWFLERFPMLERLIFLLL
jgi:hypothetical protein